MCFGYNSCMVALTKKSANFPQRPIRVRAKNHRYRLGAERCSKSNSRANLRRPTYDECNRLESCSKDPVGYKDGPSLFSYVQNRPLSLIDPMGLACKAVCVSEKDTYTNWSLLDVIAIQVTAFPPPSPSATVSATTGMVITVKCLYERKQTKTYRCMPCAWNPKKLHPNNTCTATCKQAGDFDTALNTRHGVMADSVSLSWTPSWWPPGMPYAGIDFWDFSSPADKGLAKGSCPTQQLESKVNPVTPPMDASFCAPSSFGGHCTSSCP
jgi:hypothetical protein